MASVEIRGQPEDPRDKYYLQVCFVCNESAKPGQEHLRNYGGIICYSCRAFWRRSHQNSRRPNFICKKNQGCIITVAVRRKCQKCRYERCLVAGMKPDAVLNDEQKKVRFRKLLMKRQKLLARQMKVKHRGPRQGKKLNLPEAATIYPQTFLGTPANNNPYPQQHQFSDPDDLQSQLRALDHVPSSDLNLSQESGENESLNFSIEEGMFQESPADKIRSIVGAYLNLLATLRSYRTDFILGKLYALQSGFENSQFISKSDILFLTHRLSQAFGQFAMSLREFVSLENVYQEKLLSQNTPLFVQFFLGHNFLIETKHKSRGDTNMEEQTKKKKIWMTNFAQRLFLERFNSTTNLFLTETDLDEYGKQILKLKGLPELVTCKQMAVLTYILLFHPGDIRFKNLDELFNTYIRTCNDCLTLPNLITTLTSMANFFTDNFNRTKNEWNGYLAN